MWWCIWWYYRYYPKRLGGNTLGFTQDKRSKRDDDASLEFIDSGDLVSFGLIPELIGRLHILTTLNEITRDDMIKILVEPKNSLVTQYKKLFEIDNVRLSFEQDALESIAQKAINRKTGARGLRSIMEEVLLDIMYDAPNLENYEVVITKDVVENKDKAIYIKNKISA